MIGTLSSTAHPVVVGTLRLLARDPSLGGKEIAADLGLSLSRLARVFKAEMGMSLVEYRNRLRLERFDVLLDAGGDNLLEAALTAGFGSYSQFHRVFRALRGASPKEYIRGARLAEAAEALAKKQQSESTQEPGGAETEGSGDPGHRPA
jgi:AraC-like DNA-binding protein